MRVELSLSCLVNCEKILFEYFLLTELGPLGQD